MDYLSSALRAFPASSLGEIRAAPGNSLLSLQTWLSSRQQAEHCELKAVVTLVSVRFTAQNVRSCCNSTRIIFLPVLPEVEAIYFSNYEPAHWEAL